MFIEHMTGALVRVWDRLLADIVIANREKDTIATSVQVSGLEFLFSLEVHCIAPCLSSLTSQQLKAAVSFISLSGPQQAGNHKHSRR